MRIATWNVNSIRVRVDQVCDWASENAPDVLCLQELKAQQPEFPYDRFTELGYEAVVHGQKTYNGVAILSRVGLADAVRGFDDGDEAPQARIVRATCGGVRVVNFYVPNGEALDSEKYPYKLAWLARARAMFDAQENPNRPLVLVGDFNVTTDDRDLWDPEGMRGSVHHSKPERDALERLKGWGLEDCLRLHHDEAGIYSWWDYRMLAYQKRRGLRIDLVLATRALAEACTDCFVDKRPRKLKRPSDHAPVVADFDL